MNLKKEYFGTERYAMIRSVYAKTLNPKPGVGFQEKKWIKGLDENKK